MQRRSCYLCGCVASGTTMKQTKRNKNLNLVLIGSLAMRGFVDGARVNDVVEEISSCCKYYCCSHTVQAAQYITAEIIAAGRQLSYYEEPGRGSVAYVTTAGIPPHLVEVLNGLSTGSVVITARDVFSFVNEALRKHYGTSLWPGSYEEEEGVEEAVPVGNEVPVACLEEKPKVKVEVVRRSVEEENEIEEDDEEAVTEEGSEYEPGESDGDDSCGEGVEDIGETDPATLKKYFIVQGRSLMTLFRFCPQCGHRIRKAQLKAVGTAATVRFACEGCTVTPKRWESQDRAVAHSRERMLRGNVVAAVAAITTGVRYVELSRWADQMNLAMFSKAFFWKIFVWTKPAIESVYRSQQRMVLDMVKREYREGEGLHLAADGAYDSRGYTAMIGKVLISDARTKLVLHTEVLHRSETENISTRMEVEGLKRLMRWVGGCGLRVASVTTDRSRALGAALRELEPELGAISHYYDGWHLVKWLGNELRKASKLRDCEEIGVWTEKVKTHLWTAIHSGAESGADMRALFNTCLMHVAGVHQWPLNELTGRFTSCPHDSLPGPRPQNLSADSVAYQKFRDVILTKSFQRDLMKASTYGGTSICEAKNALDRIYCRKEIFYPIATYPLYAMMATLHMNTLRLAEISGERKVLKTREVQRKYLNRKSKQVLKSPAKHLWRDLVLDEVLNGRLMALQARYQSGVPQWVVDLMDAEDEYEREL